MIIQQSMFSGTTQESVEFLKDNLSGKGIIFVGFSGGKDSIVTAELMKLSGLPCQLYHYVTGIDAPELKTFIRRNYPDCKFLYPTSTFWHNITTRNPPANFSRWCCTTLKKNPGKNIPIKHRVMGIRAEESTKRAKYGRINEFKKLNQVLYYPILNWQEWQIWEFIDSHQLAYPSLYDQGFNRLGCIICPYHSSANGRGHDLYRERWPGYFKAFERYYRIWYEKRKGQGREMYHDTVEESIAEWYKGNVKWYKH